MKSSSLIPIFQNLMAVFKRYILGTNDGLIVPELTQKAINNECVYISGKK